MFKKDIIVKLWQLSLTVPKGKCIKEIIIKSEETLIAYKKSMFFVESIIILKLKANEYSNPMQ